MTSKSRFCIGGIDKNTSRDYHLIRFIEEKDVLKCQSGTFLVGSIDRNKRFDDERADGEEFTATISWPNKSKEQWTISGEDGPKYLGIRPGKKITGLAGRGGLARSGRPLVGGNPLSISLSMIPKTLCGTEKRVVFEQIRRNLGLPKGTPALWFTYSDETFRLLTRRLSEHLKITNHLVIISGTVVYQERTIVVNSFQEFKDTADKLYNSGELDLDRLFAKPRVPYRNDREYRAIWMTHSGRDPNRVEFPLLPDYQENDHILLEDIDFNDHFTLVTQGNELH